jgi:cytochrome P450
VRNVAAIVYAAGSDTTSTAILTLILAMLLHPEMQCTAQAELDRVVGSSRLPTFQDKEHLPYIRCLVLECLRWHSAVPLGLVHIATQDDEYCGYRIPKGTSVMPNIW